MFHIPFSKMNAEPSTPLDDILALIASSALIILSGDGQTTQITDQHGRTLNGTTPQSRIPNMAAVPLVSGSPNDDVNVAKTVNHGALARPVRLAALGFPETYVLRRPPSFERVASASAVARPTAEVPIGRQPVSPEIELAGEDATLTWEIASTGDAPYAWGIRSPAGSIVATVPANATGASDVVVVQNVARSLPKVTFQAPSGVTKTASVTLAGPAVEGSAQARIYEVSGLSMSGAPGITLQLIDGGDSLQIVNPGGDSTLVVRIQAGSQSANAISRTVVATGGNAAVVVAPASWSAPSLASSAVTVKNYDRAGGTVLKQTQL